MSEPDWMRIIGNANQDQDLARVLQTWTATDVDMMDELVCWLVDDGTTARDFFTDLPLAWVHFIQLCCLVGLREALLRNSLDSTENQG